VGTFETFPSSYSASTFVTLTDERDGNNYAIVKIGNRWIMAQNLNYQKGLTFQQKAADPSTATGSNKDLIGSFWCSGTNGATTSTKTSCDVWGAFYSWETAMMVDGKWSDDNRNSSSWTEPVYGTSTSAGNTNNGGRGANGHGICPPNWHVTTDAELGDVLDAIETGTKSHNTGTGSWRGTNAGKGAKAACTCPTTTACASDQEAMWNRDVSSSGIDSYGFRVLPAGERYYTGSSFPYRGVYAIFWSSSAYSSSAAWRRYFYYAYSTVYRTTDSRSYGFPVRCIRDL
jgi:uncharacterized protein (TIGR02145 family)